MASQINHISAKRCSIAETLQAGTVKVTKELLIEKDQFDNDREVVSKVYIDTKIRELREVLTLNTGAIEGLKALMKVQIAEASTLDKDYADPSLGGFVATTVDGTSATPLITLRRYCPETQSWVAVYDRPTFSYVPNIIGYVGIPLEIYPTTPGVYSNFVGKGNWPAGIEVNIEDGCINGFSASPVTGMYIVSGTDESGYKCSKQVNIKIFETTCVEVSGSSIGFNGIYSEKGLNNKHPCYELVTNTQKRIRYYGNSTTGNWIFDNGSTIMYDSPGQRGGICPCGKNANWNDTRNSVDNQLRVEWRKPL